MQSMSGLVRHAQCLMVLCSIWPVSVSGLLTHPCVNNKSLNSLHFSFTILHLRSIFNPEILTCLSVSSMAALRAAREVILVITDMLAQVAVLRLQQLKACPRR